MDDTNTPQDDSRYAKGQDDDCGCSNSLEAQSTSRRNFLKAASTVAVSVATTTAFALKDAKLAVAQTPPPPEVRQAVPIDLVERALSIAKTDDMFQQLIDESQGFNILVNASEAKLVSVQDSIVGLVLQVNSTSNPRIGINIILSVDVTSNILSAIQSIRGWCLQDRLEIISTRFDARWTPYPEILNPRILEGKPSPLKRPRRVREWTFLRSEPSPLQKEEILEIGWPKETADTCYWHFLGCSNATWVNEDKINVYLCTEVIEQKSCNPDEQNKLELTYSDVEKL